MLVHLSVPLHGTERLPPDGFLSTNSDFGQNKANITDILHDDLRTFVFIPSPLFFLIIQNVFPVTYGTGAEKQLKIEHQG
jgi:hypothetical protein